MLRERDRLGERERHVAKRVRAANKDRDRQRHTYIGAYIDIEREGESDAVTEKRHKLIHLVNEWNNKVIVTSIVSFR
jgi:hypothetical protein